ncbi:hypothetical protein Tco_0532565 [Tanacetum coccineum]
MKDPGLFILPCRLGDSKPFDTLADLGSCVNLLPLKLFIELKVGLLEETDNVLELADRAKTWKRTNVPLLVGRGFLATANAVIDCKKAKITVGERLTRLIFGVKELDFGDDNEPYWTTIGKRESYKPQTSKDGICAQPPYYAKSDFWNNHLPEEWEIARDAEVNPFKDVLVFRKMVEFLGAIPINLKGNMWESKDLTENLIDWNRPPKEGDGEENPIRTLGDYSRASHEGYRNTIELPKGNNVVSLRSDTIRLVQNGCSFHGLQSEDLNQHLKVFYKLEGLH